MIVYLTDVVLKAQHMETQSISLNSLKRVSASKSSVILRFSKTFDYKRKTTHVTGRVFDKTDKTDTIILYMNDYENANRVGSAFARMLQLCGEEQKEPF